ncbi:MAG: hypothetical protein WC269_03640 [Candidatus Gracilibacteria bacterium]|jgi:hypothetical protein
MKNKLIQNLIIVAVATISAIGFNMIAFAETMGDQPVPTIQEIFNKSDQASPDAKDVITNLPEVDIPSAVTTIIKNILNITFLLTLIALIVAGIYYLISEGNEEETGKAKKIILYIVIGMAIIGASYGIVSGISRFKLLE